MTVTQLIAKKFALFQEMREVALEQEKAISADQLDIFSDLTLRGDRLRQEISRLDGEIKKNLKDKGVGGEDNKARAMTRDIKDLIQSIQAIDRRVEEMIRQEKTKIAIAIKQLREGQKAMKGYGRKSANYSRFIDRCG